MDFARLSLAGLLSASALAAAAISGPAEWTTVNTNAAAAWRKDRGAPDFVLADKDARAVTFLAESSGLQEGNTVEFILAGPLSDRAYETMFMSLAKPEDVTAALDAVGIPRGVPPDAAAARLWPQGERVSVTFTPAGKAEKLALPDFLARRADSESVADPLALGAVCTGGAREADGALTAATNIPCAIFAAYNHAPSPILFRASLDQSVAYGSFLVKRPFAPGDLVEVRVAWDGTRRVRDWTCHVTPAGCAVKDASGAELFSGEFAAAAGFIREQRAKDVDVYLKLAFAPETTVAFAQACARLFARFDGDVARLNGFAPGQLFAKAFLPEESWRNRKQRVAQPFEIYPAADGKSGKFIFVEEVWDLATDSLDPELRPHEHAYGSKEELLKLVAESGRQADKMFTAFIYLPKGSAVGPALAAAEMLRPRVTTFYVFEGTEP